ncbi:hypothetical protein [Gordonia sp. CPCC 205333]|uniref:hypothetical protein n=1 Tax=Gordonia sp. CPCC 205333 TaxID=3140790 RepID=UPI003AF335F5
MTQYRFRIRSAVAAVVAAGALATSIAGGTGQASALAAYRLTSCIGLSPNVVDFPYNPTLLYVDQFRGKTILSVDASSYWGYQSAMRFDLRNLQTGKRLTVRTDQRVLPPNTGFHKIYISPSRIGKGRVKVTLSTVNRNALWSVPATTCSAVVAIR